MLAMVALALITPLIGNAGDTTNLVSWWSCDETSGDRADSHGTNHLTDNNTVLSATGKQGNACDVESSNTEYLSITDASQSGLENHTDASWCYWIKPESVGTYGNIIGKSTGASENITRLSNSSPADIYASVYDGSTYTAGNIGASISAGTWYHHCFIFDGSEGDIYWYEDGVYQSPVRGTATAFGDNTGSFYIGRAGSAWYYDGLVDEAQFFSERISTTTVLELYGAGSGIDYDTFSAATTSTSTTSTSSALGDLEEVIWTLEIYLSWFLFLIMTYIGYRFTKLFL